MNLLKSDIEQSEKRSNNKKINLEAIEKIADRNTSRSSRSKQYNSETVEFAKSNSNSEDKLTILNEKLRTMEEE